MKKSRHSSKQTSCWTQCSHQCHLRSDEANRLLRFHALIPCLF
ncbi:hypothetical protein HMPREF1868_00095 [Olsenella sp. DNF00959]|nr:hypothetical protein HMPREF1868_00095 [Olsenella sp. DNF00959]